MNNLEHSHVALPHLPLKQKVGIIRCNDPLGCAVCGKSGKYPIPVEVPKELDKEIKFVCGKRCYKKFHERP